MAANVGRTIVFEWNGSEVEGVREKSVALAGEPIDVTSDDDDGWRKLLNVPAENQVEISISGVTKSTVLRQAWFGADKMGDVVITFPGGDTIEGEFFLSTHNDTGPYNDAMTFEATLISSGEVVYTPAGVPVNSILPAISGTAQVGVPLTALPGDWSGVVSYAYAWKAEGVAIPGATSQSYTPVVGDVGDNLTCTVTATNGAGSASATSAETLAVIAA